MYKTLVQEDVDEAWLFARYHIDLTGVAYAWTVSLLSSLLSCSHPRCVREAVPARLHCRDMQLASFGLALPLCITALLRSPYYLSLSLAATRLLINI